MYGQNLNRKNPPAHLYSICLVRACVRRGVRGRFIHPRHSSKFALAVFDPGIDRPSLSCLYQTEHKREFQHDGARGESLRQFSLSVFAELGHLRKDERSKGTRLTRISSTFFLSCSRSCTHNTNCTSQTRSLLPCSCIKCQTLRAISH